MMKELQARVLMNFESTLTRREKCCKWDNTVHMYAVEDFSWASATYTWMIEILRIKMNNLERSSLALKLVIYA